MFWFFQRSETQNSEEEEQDHPSRPKMWNPKAEPIVSSEEDISAKPTNLISEFPDRVFEEQLSLSPKKKVTFDTNVKTYEPVSVLESTDFLPETDKDIEKKKKENNNSLGKSSSSHSISEDDSITSSTRSYPPNHRYQNCRDSDDELEEFECEEDSDLDDDDDDDEELKDFGGDSDEDDEDNRIVSQPVWSESIPIVSAESSTEISLANQEVKTIGCKQNEIACA